MTTDAGFTPDSAATPAGFLPDISIDLERFGTSMAFSGRDRPPRLVVVVDTEEEFDWAAPFSRDSTGVVSASEQDRAHEIFDPLGVRPTYVIDYCIASNPESSKYFRQLQESGRCVVGAHLHPWVTPPHDETVNTYNSYHGNLPVALEQSKLRILTQAIADSTGKQPDIFKAGRYGLGPNSLASVWAEGYRIDCSVVPHVTFERDGGPSYHGWPAQPFWIDRERRFLEVPLSCGFAGIIPAVGRRFPAIFDNAQAERFLVPGLLARSGMVERVTLTPEGITAPEQIRLLKALYRQGIREFSLTYHSPSLGIGYTPYVRDESDRREFLSRLNDVLRFFRDELGGEFTTMAQLYQDAVSHT